MLSPVLRFTSFSVTTERSTLLLFYFSGDIMFSTSVVKKPALVWSGYAIICTALLSVTTDGTT